MTAGTSTFPGSACRAAGTEDGAERSTPVPSNTVPDNSSLFALWTSRNNSSPSAGNSSILLRSKVVSESAFTERLKVTDSAVGESNEETESLVSPKSDTPSM
nr:hypothetical protein Iba_chr02bCG25240 [Ipomoea batatas]